MEPTPKACSDHRAVLNTSCTHQFVPTGQHSSNSLLPSCCKAHQSCLKEKSSKKSYNTIKSKNSTKNYLCSKLIHAATTKKWDFMAKFYIV